LPIIILYFNSFPMYFLWNNLWAIPAFTLLLYSLVIGIFLGFTGWDLGTHVWFQIISEGQGWLSNWVTVNSLLPGAQWLYLFPSSLFCWVLGGVIGIALFSSHRRAKWALLGTLIGILPWLWESPSMQEKSFCIWGRPAHCSTVNGKIELVVTPKDSTMAYQKLEHLLAGRAYHSARLIIKSEAP